MSALTQGVHHVGLTVLDLEEAKNFFIDVLGYQLVGTKPEYPAAFVSDGVVTLTLWQVKDRARVNQFNHRQSIGLHHLALQVGPDDLDRITQRVVNTPGVVMEFYPEPLGGGPARHTMFYTPGGIRLELIAPGA